MMRTKQNGFTLVEVMLASFISIILISGIAAMWYWVINNYQFVTESNQSVAITEAGISQMVRDLREMRDGEDGSYPLHTVNDYELVFNSDVDNDGRTERVRYYAENDILYRQVFNLEPPAQSYPCLGGCTICHLGTEVITISERLWPRHKGHNDYIASSCESPPGEDNSETSESIIATSLAPLTEPFFTYYNGQWPRDTTHNPLSLNDRHLDTRYINIKLSVNTTSGEVGPETVSFTNSVHLRNLKDNL